MKNNSRINIPIFGNGDVDGPQKALEMKNRYGVDGVMIGRASIGHPGSSVRSGIFWKPAKSWQLHHRRKVSVCRAHLEKSIAWKGEVLGVLEMRRHYTNYFKACRM